MSQTETILLVVLGFSEAQAESARAPDRAMAPRALVRKTDTSGSLSMGGWSGCRAVGPTDRVDVSSIGDARRVG